ncbi:MAG: EAL domain-containing protein [Gammaproteobacteria bacterium]
MSRDGKSIALPILGKRLIEALAIALAYVATAKLGFLVAIPPGNVTPVWPPSGLALAAALLFGYRSGLGIWLGSFSVNTWFLTQTIAFSAAPLIMASSIATGSTLQALCAAFLVKRVVRTSRPERLDRAVKFLGIAVLSCLIASCWGVTTLLLASLVSLGNYSYTWFTWWLGDLAGILIFTPVLIVLSETPRRRLSSQMAFPLLGFGSGLTLIAFFALWQMERHYLGATHSFWPWGFLLAGLSFTALLSAYIEAHRKGSALLGAQRDLEARVQERARELAQANQELRTEIAERERAVVQLQQEVTERQHMEAALRESQDKLNGILGSLNDVVWSISPETYKTFYINPAAERLYGHRTTEFLENPQLWQDLIHPDDREMADQSIRRLKNEGEVNIEYRIVRPDGQVRWLHDRGYAVRDGQGNVIRFDGIAADITERKQAEERLTYLAQYDTLTGLPNRHLFRDRLMGALSRAKRDEKMVALMFMDLDRFKEINDTLAHITGDRVLQGVAKRLNHSIRAVDTLARIGGDEFTIILDGITHMEQVSRPLQKVHDTFSLPILVDDREIYMSASIGIAIYPTHGQGIDELLRYADIAMYQAKQEGCNTHQFYTPAIHAKTTERVTLEGQLRRALEREEFSLHYQPQLEIHTAQVIGTEALVRWRNATLGQVPPNQFIPLAEETGLIVRIGEWVLRTACAQNKAWQANGLPPVVLAVNISARQFREKTLLKMIEELLEETGLAPHYLDLEITEGTIMHGGEENITALESLSLMGIQLAVDDFGTGYSSLNYLKRFPVHKLKIDQTFVRDITNDPNDAAIVSAIIALAKNLKLKVIAEGVETKEQLAFLQSLNCDEYQGYYFSRPVPAEDFTALLRKQYEPISSGATTR